jgi:ribulose-phosphate 3-epimerase
MVTEPERVIADFAEAGADILTLHAEATPHLHRAVQAIKKRGLKAGVSLNPSTPVSAVEEILPSLDLLLIMTVNPGFGGQSFIDAVLPKIEKLRRLLDEGGHNAELEVDGGVNEATAQSVVRAGGRVLVAGSAIFNRRESVAEAVARLRASVAGT